MVAEVAVNESCKKRTKGRNHAIPAIPLVTRQKAYNLYVSYALEWKEIAERTGVAITRLQQLASREGWTHKRRNIEAKIKARMEQRMDSRIDEVSEALASESEEIALTVLGRTREAAESQGPFAAKDAQSWSAAARNLVSVSRAIRDPQASALSGNGQGAASISLFVLRVGDGVSPMKNVSPVEQAPIELRDSGTVSEPSAAS